MLNIKLIAAAVIALLIIGIAAYIGIQSKRIDLLKAENTALRVSLESAEGAIIKQNETITALMSQLSQSDAACQKQLNARNTVKAILKNNTKPPVSIKAQSDAALIPPASHPAVTPQEQIKNYEIIDHEKNLAAVTYLNELFGMRPSDGL